MAQNPRGGSEVPATPPRPTGAPAAPRIVDEIAERNRKLGPKRQVLRRGTGRST